MCERAKKDLLFEEVIFGESLSSLTLTSQVYKATIASKVYAAKLYEQYSSETRDVDRVRLRSYKLSNADLEARFYPWRREKRVYERIDSCIQGSKRHFFPEYFGATILKQSLCPREWRLDHNGGDDVPVIFLELLDGTQASGAMHDLQISDTTRQEAKELYSQGVDAEYVHIYVHCMEKIEVLHDAKIIHGDIKPDVFMNCASVVCDFSRSWSWENGEPCLDSFLNRLGPRSFETRREGERKLVKTLVTKEHKENGKELRSRVPSWQACGRCQGAMRNIVLPERNIISDRE